MLVFIWGMEDTDQEGVPSRCQLDVLPSVKALRKQDWMKKRVNGGQDLLLI